MLLPNVEGIVIAALKADPAVTAAKAIVVPALPVTKTWPAIRVVRFGGAPAVAHPLVLDEAHVQIDAFATGKQAAFDLANASRAALTDLPGVHRLGTVTGVDVGGLSYVPDDTFDPAIPRYVLDVVVWAKPTAHP